MEHSEKLGKEKIPRLLLNMSLPSIMGMLAVTLYHVADTIFVGRGVGTLAIAALSVSMPFLMSIAIFGQAISIGGASIISRALGAGDKEKANLTLNNLVHTISIINVVVIIVAFVFIRPVLIVFGAGESYIDLAVNYTQIALIGSFFMNYIHITMNSIRAEGNAKFAMQIMIFGAVLNLIVDPIFIFVFDWGIRGAALATVLSQMSGAVLATVYLFSGRGALRLSLSKIMKWPQFSILKESFGIGSASFARQAASTLIVILINNSLLHYGGPVYVAAFGIVFRLLMFNFMPLIGINQGFMPIAGYNYGAGNYSRVMHVLRAGIRAATVFSVVSFCIFFFLSHQLITVFTEDEALIEIAEKALRIMVLMLPLIGLQIIGSGLFQALGKIVPALLLGLSRQVLFLIPLALILPRFWGAEGVWFSFPASDFLAAFITTLLLYREIKKLNKCQ
ncbi:MAG: MATE family efflux transporter [Candidatus Delongbacteria bacterium]|jgi:putative MATE family efflux protein|nr:MATE family efflux transporter [Candidatus Delongbacteria bacterium]